MLSSWHVKISKIRRLRKVGKVNKRQWERGCERQREIDIQIDSERERESKTSDMVSILIEYTKISERSTKTREKVSQRGWTNTDAPEQHANESSTHQTLHFWIYSRQTWPFVPIWKGCFNICGAERGKRWKSRRKGQIRQFQTIKIQWKVTWQRMMEAGRISTQVYLCNYN